VRLVCLSLATFFLAHTILVLLARPAVPAVMRRSEALQPRAASRLLFALRMLPSMISLFVVAGLCVPSYLRLEPESASERIGIVCVLAALAGAALCISSLLRGLFSLVRSLRYVHACEKFDMTPTRPLPRLGLGHDSRSLARVLMVEQERPTLALAGVFHPRLIISSNVMRELTADQLEAALRHEDAHRISRDNLKRLLLAVAPDILPWPSANSFTALERRWSRLTECAADDDAAGGDSGRALSLAAALVAFAKMGLRANSEPAVSFLVANDCDLSLRVERLLQVASKTNQNGEKQGTLPSAYRFLPIAGGLLVTASLWPATLSVVHEALEHLVH
jgi:Zn-dependent protease with chaperone function